MLMFILLFEVLLYFILPYVIHPKTHPIDEKQWQALLQQIQEDTATRSTSKPHVLSPFVFNPNTLDSAGFVRLGLDAKLAATILHYRKKGGHFYQKESFKKIWGLHEADYQQLAPYIQIPKEYDVEVRKKISVELNHCDTAALIELNGIGAWMAQHIIEYRTALGGFVHKEQLQEVYGLRPETWSKIKDQVWVKTSRLKRINLNTATLSEMNRHPYLKGEIALALVNYRKEHDYSISSLQELRQIPLINEELFRKIAPYITLQ
jgi:DNA uptake protein ComE-like DNA-binding protein